VVALDRSSSMKGRKLKDAILALRTLIESAPEGVAMSALAFDRDITHLFPKTRLDEQSRPILLRRLEGLTHGLGTDHSAALLQGFTLGNQSGGAAHLLLVTDGYPSQGITHLDQLVDLVQRGRGETTVSTLGIGHHAEGWVLGALARTGGGIYQHAAPQGADGAAASILPAIGAELGLLHHLYAPDVRVRFEVRPPVRLRKIYYRGSAWRDGGSRVVRLPRLVKGEPLTLSFELERHGEGPDPDPWGLLEVRLTTAAGAEERMELPLLTDFADAAAAPDPEVAAAVLKHRVGIAIIDACTTGDRQAGQAAGWLKQRLGELRALAEDHGLEDAALGRAFDRAAELRAQLGERMGHTDKNILSELAEVCTRGMSSDVSSILAPPLDVDMRTRVFGLEMLKPPPKKRD
jgi:hypothetical protein